MSPALLEWVQPGFFWICDGCFRVMNLCLVSSCLDLSAVVGYRFPYYAKSLSTGPFMDPSERGVLRSAKAVKKKQDAQNVFFAGEPPHIFWTLLHAHRMGH